MPGSDYSKQLEKRQKIKRTTLVVGLDIGYEFNAMGLMNKEGEVIGRYEKVYNSRRGFAYFVQAIELAKRKHGLKEVLIGMEPTGHYWRKIAYFAQGCGYEVRFVRTTALKHQRELDESSSAKCDIKDAVTIANIVREGKYIDTVIEDGVYRQLRTLAKMRERLQRYYVGSQHALRAVIDDYFPELTEIFWAMKAKGLWAVLERSPFPQDVLGLGLEELTEIIARGSKRKFEAGKKARVVYQAAGTSIGLTHPGVADYYRLKIYLSEVKRMAGQIKELELEMKKLLKQAPLAKYLISIRGIGVISAAVFLGELGSPEHFKGFKQIVKYAGYDPQEHDSGLRTGRKIISKKGRWLLRKILYFMSLGAIRQNKYFRDYYDRKLAGRNRFGRELTKKEALCAVVIKLIKVIFALFRDRRMFSIKTPALALV